MAIVLTNGEYYIGRGKKETGKSLNKTKDITGAKEFVSVNAAIFKMKAAPGKTKSYYVFDTETRQILWKWIDQENTVQTKDKLKICRDSRGKIKRKTYPESVRKQIYLKADGRCELCGKKLLFKDMTIDHVKPLSMGGVDTIENLSCACFVCNRLKGNILPDTFMERVTKIFMFQMEKKSKTSIKSKIKWAIMKNMILSCGNLE